MSAVRDPSSTAPAGRGRAKLALLGLFFLLPFVASWAVWHFDLMTGAAGNYGTLLPPQPVALPAPELRGKWVLVQFDGGACDSGCERKLYFMRQVRRAQGRDMQRVARLWLVTDQVQPSASLQAAIEGTVTFPANRLPPFPAERSPIEHLYLVDPLGNLMMRFPRDPEPARVIKDLQRLLKSSSFG
jgi:hypothetical protein